MNSNIFFDFGIFISALWFVQKRRNFSHFHFFFHRFLFSFYAPSDFVVQSWRFYFVWLAHEMWFKTSIFWSYWKISCSRFGIIIIRCHNILNLECFDVIVMTLLQGWTICFLSSVEFTTNQQCLWHSSSKHCFVSVCFCDLFHLISLRTIVHYSMCALSNYSKESM